MKSILFAVCALGACSATLARTPGTLAVIASASSSENITHLAPGTHGGTAPGGANAARWLEVTAAVFQSDGNTPAGAGERVTFVAFDREESANREVLLVAVDALTDARGVARARLPIGECRGVGVTGPLSLHRGSNRPEYWDITFVPDSTVEARTNRAVPARKARFQHVCKERYRGSRP
ncbi:MAG: hypothetical protein ABWZ85_03920 [Luteibacter sp.]